MQYLMKKLAEKNYTEWHRVNEETMVMEDLMYANPDSLDLLHAFPRVLLMDCTYKTNHYNLPLLQIVGVTSTNLSFFIAFAYL